MATANNNNNKNNVKQTPTLKKKSKIRIIKRPTPPVYFTIEGEMFHESSLACYETSVPYLNFESANQYCFVMEHPPKSKKYVFTEEYKKVPSAFNRGFSHYLNYFKSYSSGNPVDVKLYDAAIKNLGSFIDASATIYDPNKYTSSFYSSVNYFPDNFTNAGFIDMVQLKKKPEISALVVEKTFAGKDYAAAMDTNFPEVLQSKFDEINDAAKQMGDIMADGVKDLIKKVVPVGFPPPKLKMPENALPGTFWYSLQQKIEKIPNHGDIENMIIQGIADGQCGLTKIKTELHNKLEEYKQKTIMFFQDNEDIVALEEEIIQNILTLKRRSMVTRPDIQTMIHSRLVTYKKEKDKKVESIVEGLVNALLNSISSLVTVILDKLIDMMDPVIAALQELFQDIVDIFESLMGSIAKRFDSLIKPATPPSDIPGVIEWAAAVAKLFFGPIADMGEQVAKFVVKVMPVVQALIKKVNDSESLVLCCAPKILATGGTPASVIQHYMKDLGLDISKINMLTSPDNMLKSATSMVVEEFKKMDFSDLNALDKQLNQDITKTLLGIDLEAEAKKAQEQAMKELKAANDKAAKQIMAKRAAQRKKKNKKR